MLSAMKAYIVGILLAASVFLFGVLSAFGDTYSVNVVTNTQSENFYGIDAAGNFVVNETNSLVYPGSSCGGIFKVTNCFATYYVGQQSPVYTAVAPNLNWDNGSGCTDGGLSGICNNGHELLGGYLGDIRGVWTGTDPLTDFLTSGSFDGGFINSRGDAVFIDGVNDTLVSVMDSPGFSLTSRALIVDPKPVPEPPSVWLLGLGMMVSGMFLVRRRAVCRVEARKFRK